MKPKDSKILLGYLTPFGPSPDKNLTPIGLQAPVYGSMEKPFAVETDARGNAFRFLPMEPLTPAGYVPAPVATRQHLGAPSLCIFVAAADAPASMVISPWHEMVGTVLKSYFSMREEYKRYPVAGFKLAGFVAGLVPRYAVGSGRTGELKLEAYQFESDRLKMDDQTIFQKSPEVQRLARDAGITLSGGYGINPTPEP